MAFVTGSLKVLAIYSKAPNRASRSLDSQPVNGASRRLDDQRWVGASRPMRRLAAVALSVSALKRLWRWLAPEVHPQEASAVLSRPRSLPQHSICTVRLHAPARALPNPSLKRSANGRPPAPGRWYAVHFHRPGAGVPPSSPA